MASTFLLVLVFQLILLFMIQTLIQLLFSGATGLEALVLYFLDVFFSFLQLPSIHFIDRKTKREIWHGDDWQKTLQTFILLQTYFGSSICCNIPGFTFVCLMISRNMGNRFNKWESKSSIVDFIKENGITHSEINEATKDLADYKTLNDFFYRKLKPGSRPIHEPANQSFAVCPCDSWMTVFPIISDLQNFAVKGSSFTLSQFLGNDEELVQDFTNGSAIICRLLPRFYHRFHSPISAKYTGKKYELGNSLYLYRHGLKVNALVNQKRVLLLMESKEFGRVLFCPIGALGVGTINVTIEPGEIISKGDDIGYFAFGGSCVVVLFQKGAIQFSDDLVKNFETQTESMVYVGQPLGESKNIEKMK